jgi:hypothetical protein
MAGLTIKGMTLRTALRAKGCQRCQRIACGGKLTGVRHRLPSGQEPLPWTWLVLCPGCIGDARANPRFDVYLIHVHDGEAA